MYVSRTRMHASGKESERKKKKIYNYSFIILFKFYDIFNEIFTRLQMSL